jgi:hypothetical protein
MRNLSNSMLVWRKGTVRLVRWPDTNYVHADYDCSWGACNADVREGSRDYRRSELLGVVARLVHDYDIPSAAVFAAIAPLQELVP